MSNLDNLTPFNAMGNEFLTILQDVQGLHITARQKHEELLALCKKRRVAFKDIRSHLIKQAKKCGLHRKSVWDDKLDSFRYRNYAELSMVAWYVQIKNFCSYVNRNYSDYGVKAGRKASGHGNGKKATFIRKTTKVNADTGKTTVDAVRTDIEGVSKEELLSGEVTEVPVVPEVPEVPVGSESGVVPATPEVGAEAAIKQQESADKKLEESAGTVAPAPEGPKLDNGPVNKGNNSITRKTDKELTNLEKATIVMQNLNILGDIASKKGCADEFNALMIALGTTEFCIDEEPAKLQAIG